MSEQLSELTRLFELEYIEQHIYRGVSQELHLPQLFGGQVLGQAAMAATLTLNETKSLHSIHGYFIRPGKASLPVVYKVERLHDGRSFSTRQITASQRGKPIFTAAASFHIRETGLGHQSTTMDKVPRPETLPQDIDLITVNNALADQVRQRHGAAGAIEVRPVDPIDPSVPLSQPAIKRFWFRAVGPLPESPILHRNVLAYASDIGLLITSLLPHGVSDLQPDMQVASLDHALWIHRDVKVDDWLLYSMDSPWSGGARGLSRGSIFSARGELVASVAQEGLIRKR